MKETDRKQTERNTNGTFAKGNNIAKSKGVDFGSKPENRHKGAWKKTDTARYKLEQIIKLNSTEIDNIIQDKNSALFDKKLAQSLKEADWKTLRDIIHEVYGRPKEAIPEEKENYTVALVKYVGADDSS